MNAVDNFYIVKVKEGFLKSIFSLSCGLAEATAWNATTLTIISAVGGLTI